ncbi:hypothetical protein WN982_29565 [Paraburkholderia sp. IMGN_8]|uniref:hypothetical protein n=1 Tax=Paraburkholderia sp. IMGN_8 TaxID=3136564 RepID=UPI003100CA31
MQSRWKNVPRSPVSDNIRHSAGTVKLRTGSALIRTGNKFHAVRSDVQAAKPGSPPLPVDAGVIDDNMRYGYPSCNKQAH